MEEILEYLTYPFIQYALIVGVLISLCAAMLGVTLVLKRFSFIGDGLSHVAFGAMAVASVLGLMGNEMILVMPVTIICAVLLLCVKKSAKIRGDAAIAAMSVGALAIGYLLINVFSTSSNVSGDVCSSLFGSTAILTLSKTDIYICVGVCAVVLAAYIIFYNRIFAVTFDETFASSAGINVNVYNAAFAVGTAAVIVLAMNLVGSLLTSALIVFPALSSMRLFKSFKAVIIGAGAISVICAVLGTLFSILISSPVGATIVAVDILAFGVMSIVGKVRRC